MTDPQLARLNGPHAADCPIWTSSDATDVCTCPEPTTVSICYVEVFVEDFSGLYGWRCFTCELDTTGYRTLSAAEKAGEDHARFIETGDAS